MKYIIYRVLFVLGMLGYASLSPISMVYNFRLAQITKQPIFEEVNHNNYNLVALFFDQFLKKHNGTHQNFLGGLGSFIYDFGLNYFRTDVAISSIKERRNHKTTFSSVEADDVLFTLGRNFIRNKQNVLTLSVLFGVPTHKIFRLVHPEFGHSQFGTGAQLDGSCKLNSISAIAYGARYIHFVPRSAKNHTNQKYTFSIGNIADLLFASKNNWGMHGFEAGYTSRFQFGSSIFPHINDVVKNTNYIRSNFYMVYKYRFLINKVQNRLLFYVAYGFDHNSNKFSNKYIITLWTSWNIKF